MKISFKFNAFIKKMKHFITLNVLNISQEKY